MIAQALVLSDGKRRDGSGFIHQLTWPESTKGYVERFADRVYALTGISPDSGGSSCEPQPQCTLASRRKHPGTESPAPSIATVPSYQTYSLAASSEPPKECEQHGLVATVGRAHGLSNNRVHREQPGGRFRSRWCESTPRQRTIALLVNFAAHPITVGGSTTLWDAGVSRSAAPPYRARISRGRVSLPSGLCRRCGPIRLVVRLRRLRHAILTICRDPLSEKPLLKLCSG